VLRSAEMLGRRQFLYVSGALSLASFLPHRPAQASIARAVSLAELCRDSSQGLFGTALSVESVWEKVGGRRRIVSYTRLRVDERLASAGDGSELVVRTLGGQVGDVGQVVHGEALLLIGERALLFLEDAPEGVLRVTAMAQGHYPVRKDSSGELRLAPSPRLSELSGKGAVGDLVGRRPTDAGDLVRKAFRDAR